MTTKYGSHGTARYYFYRDGQELADHPANGWENIGRASMSGKVGKYFCHEQIFVRRPFGDVPSVGLDVSDFGGQPLVVKAWYDDGRIEWFCLATKEQVAAAGGTPSGYKSHVGRDGRGVEFQGHWPLDVFLASDEAKQGE